MAIEILSIPEEDLYNVIRIIRIGLHYVPVSFETKDRLLEWCKEEEEYLAK